MATWTDVTRILRSIAERPRGLRRWAVHEKAVAWERPLRKSDLEALGPDAPPPPILCVRTPLEVKEALLRSKPGVYFTTPHFDGYPAILVQLKKIRLAELRRLLASACAERAPPPPRARPRKLSVDEP